MKISSEHIQTLQYRMDIIANNIANINTPSFKEGLLFIEESFNQQEKSNNIAHYGGVIPGTGNPVLDNKLYVGNRLNLSQGALYETGNPLDLGISGEGFFRVKTPDGKLAYTRAGIFSLDSLGNMVNNEGFLLDPPLVIAENASEISIKSDGRVVTEEDGEVVEIGQIMLYKFNNPSGLEQLGHNLFLATDASGEALEGMADSEDYGAIKSGMLERSNTDFVLAMTKLIEAQRAYQFDLRVKKQQDEMMLQAIAMRG